VEALALLLSLLPPKFLLALYVMIGKMSINTVIKSAAKAESIAKRKPRTVAGAGVVSVRNRHIQLDMSEEKEVEVVRGKG
jgi:hypothetical protein